MSEVKHDRKQELEERLKQVQKQLAEVNTRIDAREPKEKAEFDHLKMRNIRRADAMLAAGRDTYLGRRLEEWAFGSASTPEQIRNALDNSSIKNIQDILGNKKNLEDSHDPRMSAALEQLRMSSLLYQYYSHTSHDMAQGRMIFEAPLAALGYQWGGPAGAGIMGLVTMNKATAAEDNFYQLQKMRTEMMGQHLQMLNAGNVYALNRNQVWLENEQMRGAASVDKVVGRARVEFQNMIAPPYEQYGAASNLRMKYESSFLNTMGRYHGEKTRLNADMFFGFSGAEK